MHTKVGMRFLQMESTRADLGDLNRSVNWRPQTIDSTLNIMKPLIQSLVVISILGTALAEGAEPFVRPDAPAFLTPDPSTDPAIARDINRVLDPLFLEFAQERDAVGASVAVSRGGKLIYARSFGYRDLADQTPAEPTTLFSVASVSKTITAVAVTRLIQERKLSLDDRYVDVLDLNPKSIVDDRIRDVTVRHLLNHTGGWDRTVSNDPVGNESRARVAEHLGIERSKLLPNHLVEHMLTKPLEFAPGTRYAYSNCGYCILGRIIEKVTGQDYATFVSSEILAPMGITSMRSHADKPIENAATPYKRLTQDGEVDRFAVCDLSVWPNKIFDAHGGWVASAVDLSRFLSTFDPNSRSRVLSPNAMKAMFSPPKGLSLVNEDGTRKPNYYGFGWDVWPTENGISAGHGGGWCGMTAYIARERSGFNWVVLTNSDSKKPSRSSTSFIGRADKALRSVKINPRFDLFRIRYNSRAR